MSSSSDDDSMPGLMDRRNNNAASNDSSSDDDDMPALVARRSGNRSDDSSSSSDDDSESDSSSSEDENVRPRANNRQRQRNARKQQERDRKAQEQQARQQRILKQREEQERLKRAEAERKVKEHRARQAAAKRKEKARLAKAREVIGSWAKTYVRGKKCQRDYQTLRQGALVLQARHRGRMVRQSKLGVQVRTQVQAYAQYRSIWQPVMDRIASSSSSCDSNWGTIKELVMDVRVSSVEDLENVLEIGQVLGDAVTQVLEEESDHEEEEEEYDEEDLDALGEELDDQLGDKEEDSDHQGKALAFSNMDDDEGDSSRVVLISSYVEKWIRQADGKFKGFLMRRLRQLYKGDRSRILAKRLKGSTNTTIYETYLEQKSGHRVLWTENKDQVMVWYVAKHKAVSRLMALIDDSQNRSSRQRMSLATAIPDMNLDKGEEDDDVVILDPLGNVPLKVYEVHRDEMVKDVASTWVPRLHLTKEEREIVETKGTVLLLGRSGTGKTVW